MLSRRHTAFCAREEREVFNMRMALEYKGQVCPLHFSRLENGVAYFQLADDSVQRQRESQGSELMGTAAGQPADTQALALGADEGEAAPPAADGAHAETPGEAVRGDLVPPPPEIGQAIMASASGPQRRAKAQAKQRPRR
jgi:hypothetical protein